MLTRVLARHVYALDLHDLPLDKLGEKKANRIRRPQTGLRYVCLSFCLKLCTCLQSCSVNCHCVPASTCSLVTTFILFSHFVERL